MLYSSGSPIEILNTRVSEINRSVTANTNILSTSISPSCYNSIFRIYVCFDDIGILKVVRVRGSTTVTENMYSGIELEADATYVFDIVVDAGESINLQYSSNANAKVLKVIEIVGGV